MVVRQVPDQAVAEKLARRMIEHQTRILLVTRAPESEAAHKQFSVQAHHNQIIS